MQILSERIVHRENRCANHLEECCQAPPEAQVQALSELAGPQHLDDSGILKRNNQDNDGCAKLGQS